MKTGDIYLTAFLFAIGFAIYLAKSVASQDQDSWKVIGAKAVLNRLYFSYGSVLF